MQAKAKVVRIVGYGAPAIRQALENGIINGDMRCHCETVLQENERLKAVLRDKNARIDALKQRVELLQADASEMRQVRMRVYRGIVEDKYDLTRNGKRRWSDMAALLAGAASGAFVVAVVALLIVA